MRPGRSAHRQMHTVQETVGTLGDIPPVGEPPSNAKYGGLRPRRCRPFMRHETPAGTGRPQMLEPSPVGACAGPGPTWPKPPRLRNMTGTQNRQDVAPNSPPPRHHLARTYRAARRNLGENYSPQRIHTLSSPKCWTVHLEPKNNRKTMTQYFSDRENGQRARTNESIDARTWGGLYAVISGRMDDASIGWRFPEQCPDGNGPCGYDFTNFKLTIEAEIPNIGLPLSSEEPPETIDALDLLEFIAASVGEPEQGSFHSYFGHHHLSWKRDEGLARFVADVNRIFSRNGIAFELSKEGQARRLLPSPMQDILAETFFQTGDRETDRLLKAAKRKITSPHMEDRRDALEKLWDAFERIKTLEPGSNKQAQAEALLNHIGTDSKFRTTIGEEAKQLTTIGNTFQIRHSETSQEPLKTSDQIDYLAHRMFSFIRLVLKASGRSG